MSTNNDTPVPEPTNAELEGALGVSRRTVQRLRHRPGCPRAGDHATFEEFVAALRAFAGRVTPPPETTGSVTPIATEPDADHPAADTGDAGTAAKAVEPPATEPATPPEPAALSKSRAEGGSAHLEAPGESGGADSCMPRDDAAVQELADTLVIILHMALALSRSEPSQQTAPDRATWVESGVKAALAALKGVMAEAEFQRTKAAVWAMASEYGYRDKQCQFGNGNRNG